jgi:hypothetical protein
MAEPATANRALFSIIGREWPTPCGLLKELRARRLGCIDSFAEQQWESGNAGCSHVSPQVVVRHHTSALFSIKLRNTVLDGDDYVLHVQMS